MHNSLVVCKILKNKNLPDVQKDKEKQKITNLKLKKKA